MPVDHPNRARAANTLAAYLRGEIDNFKLDDELDALPTDDPSLRTLRYAIWTCYDDIKRHRARGSPEVWDFLCRCVAFLRTDLELAYTKPTPEQLDFAPFRSHDEWHAHHDLFNPENLPAYDPALHTPPPRSWFDRGKLRWSRVAAALGIAILLLLACVYL